ncbi:MAG: hypothetical protein OEZ39_18495 [Gammaproteobacteria bacterium]|nr:hypothetical protein [Gammaproteobacteria bacterium]MDH5653858.1 hypothetical protein [Gammaproteobacteria bacterium]
MNHAFKGFRIEADTLHQTNQHIFLPFGITLLNIIGKTGQNIFDM